MSKLRGSYKISMGWFGAQRRKSEHPSTKETVGAVIALLIYCDLVLIIFNIILQFQMYKKVGDFKSVVTLYVEAKDWSEAFTLADKYPEYREQIYVPYAKWLAESDKFVEAQKAQYIYLNSKLLVPVFCFAKLL